MPMITDWLMVGITAVYVIATVFICIFNGKSAKATREQVAESERQFEETKRLECMPFLQMEVIQGNRKPMFELELPLYKEEITDAIYAKLLIKNLGNGTATNIIYSWHHEGLSINETDYPPINAIMQGDSYCFQFTFLVDGHIDTVDHIPIDFEYNDLLGNTYEQKFFLYFEERELIRCEADVPNFIV